MFLLSPLEPRRLLSVVPVPVSFAGVEGAGPNDGSSPVDFQPFNGSTYFLARGADERSALWRTDGTDAGTVRITDFPTAENSRAFDLRVVGGRLVFSAIATDRGRELWTSDGTAAGTSMLLDLNPGTADGVASINSVSNGLLYFTATDGTRGVELWRTDGTLAGTLRLTSLAPATNANVNTNLLFPGPGFTYFNARSAELGNELYRTDGTPAGTTLVKDINPGTADGINSNNAVTRAGVIYFGARGPSGPFDSSFWRSDGTDAGTFVLIPNASDRIAAPANAPIVLGDAVYTAARSVNGLGSFLYRTDGTAEGTVQFAIVPGTSFKPLGVVGSRFVFALVGFSNVTTTYASDGTADGTFQISTVDGFGNPGTPSVANLGGQLVFVGRTADNGSEPWITDGTPEGTRLLQDLNPGTAGSSPTGFVTVGSRVLFAADDGARGSELWSADLNSATFVHDINRRLINTNPRPLAIVGGTVLVTFAGSLFAVAPGADTPVRLAPAPEGGLFAALGEVRYFIASEPATDTAPAARGLYRTDGTPAGTTLVAPLGERGSGFSGVVAVAGALYFAASDPATGIELWRSDGTAPGTALFLDTRPGTDNGNPTFLTAVGQKLFFFADNVGQQNLKDLWVSDGTPQGTSVVAAAVAFPTFNASNSVASSGDRLLFFQFEVPGSNSNFNVIPFISDGTPEGTFALGTPGTNLPAAEKSRTSPRVRGTLGSVVFFSLFNSVTFDEVLYRTDGTVAGTAALASFADPEFPGVLGEGSGSLGSRLYFSAGPNRSSIGEGLATELWSTDGIPAVGNPPGTPPGTSLLKDLNPGPRFGSAPFGLTRVGDRLFFNARTRATGGELWVTDGTAAGTLLVADLVPGAAFSAPSNLIASGTTLVFSAALASGERALFRYDTAAPGPDLQATVVTAPAAVGALAKSRRVAVRLTNVGTALARAPKALADVIAVPAGTELGSATDIRLARVRLPVASLAAGASRNVTVSFNAPASIATGDYTLHVRFDPTETFSADTYDFNNVGAAATTTAFTAPSLDAAVAFSRPPTALKAGRPATVSVRITATGNAPASGSATVRLFFADDSTAVPTSPAIASLTRRLSLRPGGSSTFSLRVPANLVTTGSRFLYATLSYAADVADPVATNNARFSEQRVSVT